MLGDVVVAAERDGLETAAAIGIARGRVVSVGDRETVTAAAEQGARVIDATGSAVVPGFHDAHLHLVDLVRSREETDLVGARDFGQLLDAVAERVAVTPADAWIVGRGWSADSLDLAHLDRLDAAVAGRKAFLQSRDGHSAWTSPDALAAAGITASSADPTGGRIERLDGRPTGVLRETAVELVRPFVERLTGAAFSGALLTAAGELNRLGLTGVTDAGDFTGANGRGRYAALGDSFSTLADSAGVLHGRLGIRCNVPADALNAAVGLGLRTGEAIEGAAAVEVGWLKVFSDGALGSRTAALFEPYSCDAGGDGTGILTVARVDLEEIVSTARAAGIGVAVHAIGDRANAIAVEVLAHGAAAGLHRDRIEHVQLIRAEDRERLAGSGIVASMQPVHCPADRDAVDRCWAGREGDAYAWRSLADAGATLAFGSDAPVEPVNPWLGIYAAVRRRYPGDPESWHPEQALAFGQALAAYTSGPAIASGRPDRGHLRPGAVADLAILDRGLAEIVAVPEDLPMTRAQLTMVMGDTVE